MGGAIEDGTSHDDDDQCDNGAGGNGHVLMQGSESIWRKDSGERECGWGTLEGGRCRGRGRDEDEDANGQQRHDSHVLPDIEGGPLGIMNLSRIMTV